MASQDLSKSICKIHQDIGTLKIEYLDDPEKAMKELLTVLKGFQGCLK
jgi:hypothetical protein